MAYSLDSQQKVWILSKFGFRNKSQILDLFRRTIATDLLNRDMPIEQVKEFLGHVKLDTTLIYCTIKEENVRASHRKYA